MKERTLTALLSTACFLLQLAQPSQAQTERWRLIGPTRYDAANGVSAPGLGVWRCVEANSKRLLIGAQTAGIWRSDDRGGHWTSVTDSLPVEYVNSLDACRKNDRVIWAGTDMGVLRSTDDGRSWKPTALTRSFETRYSAERVWVAASPRNPAHAVATTTEGAFVTRDSGATWHQASSEKVTWWGAAYHPNRPIVYLVGHSGKEPILLRSEDNGASFVRQKTDFSNSDLTRCDRMRLFVTPADPERVGVAVFGRVALPKPQDASKNARDWADAYGLYISHDSGRTFTSIPQADGKPEGKLWRMFPVNDDPDQSYGRHDLSSKASYQQVGWACALVFSDQNPNTLVAGGSGNAISYDEGRTWSFLRRSGPPIHGDNQDARVVGNDVWMVNDGGLYHISIDTGKTEFVQGYCGTELWGFSQSFQTDILTAGVNHSGIVIRDEKLYPNGWYLYGGGDSMTASINLFDDRWIYGRPYFNKVMKRPNTLADVEGEERDSPVDFGYISYQNVEPHPNLVYGSFSADHGDKEKGRTAGIVFSDDGLQTTHLLKPFHSVHRVRVSLADPTLLYAIGDKNHLWQSKDSGKTWTELILPVAASINLQDVAIDPSDPHRVWVASSARTAANKVWCSEDGGKSWVDVSAGIPASTQILTLCPARGSRGGVWAGAYPGVYYREVSSPTWKTFGANLPVCRVDFVFPDYGRNLLRIGTSRGAWESPLTIPLLPHANFAVDSPVFSTDRRRVRFYDHSALIAKGARWHWQFAGGYPAESFERNPIVDYRNARPGKYTVTLTVTDAKGHRSTKQLTDFITVEPWPYYMEDPRNRKLEREKQR